MQGVSRAVLAVSQQQYWWRRNISFQST